MRFLAIEFFKSANTFGHNCTFRFKIIEKQKGNSERSK